ncbi:MAG: hypothetical protein KDC80_04420 [Saprospiraceae bacterium]|nr:hypothetical protein [Saprospiraceae bacterium]
MENQVSKLQKNLWIICLILAPLLIACAQFFWHNGLVTTVGGVLQVLSFTCWIFAFQGMFQVLKEDLPRYAVIGFALAVYACIGGNNFGVDGIYVEAMGITNLDAAGSVLEQIGFPTAIYLFIPGALFPLSMIILGIQLWRFRKVSPVTSLIFCIGALCFPLSRIPRIDLLAHLDNLLLIVAHLMVAWELYLKDQFSRGNSELKSQ